LRLNKSQTTTEFTNAQLGGNKAPSMLDNFINITGGGNILWINIHFSPLENQHLHQGAKSNDKGN
jgi:hypothetical protein